MTASTRLTLANVTVRLPVGEHEQATVTQFAAHMYRLRYSNASADWCNARWRNRGTARFLWSKKNVAAGVSESRRRPAADVIGNWSPDRQLPCRASSPLRAFPS